MTVYEEFLSLVRLGVGHGPIAFSESVDWTTIQALAEKQGLSGVVLDGLEALRNRKSKVALPAKFVLTQWIGEVLQDESRYGVQQKAAVEMALLFHENHIRTYVLKGDVVAECYPRPEHRVSSDMDCFLLPDQSDFDAWSLGNDMIKNLGYKIRTSFYKNSTFFLPGLTVENHKYMTPFRGNDRLKTLEIMLQSMMKSDKGEDKFEGVWLYRPPVMVSALFLIEHAYSHFLHEGLTWRHVLDWMMFSKKHEEEIDWNSLGAKIDELGFRQFYNAYYKLGQYLLGELSENDLTKLDKMMLEDVWSELDLHDSTEGFTGKLNLVGNTWRARWKYHYFADISMRHALWIQAKGVLVIKHPSLN